MLKTITCHSMSVALLAAAGCSDSGPSEPIVTNESGEVEVSTDPFSIEIRDAEGRAVLSTLDRTEMIGGTLYGSLGFVTGDDPELRYQVLTGLGEGRDPNPDNPVPPSYFSVTEVRNVRIDGETIVVELATDDPGGRSLEVSVSPDDAGTLAIRVDVSDPNGVSAVFAGFGSSTDEHFHGFGGRREGTDLRGVGFQNWVQDYRFPDLTTAYYYAQPLFFSSRGYGLLLDSDALASWRLASDTEEAWRLIVKGTTLRIVVAPGDIPSAISRITEITGRHRIAPEWSMGPMLSRTFQSVPERETVDTYRQKMEDDLENIETRDLGIESYAFEAWAAQPESFVRDVIESLVAEGRHAVLYIRSFVSDDLDAFVPEGLYDEAIENGFVAMTDDGEPFTFPSPFRPVAEAAVIDFTNPAAWEWWKAQVRQMLELGADGFMDDFGEQVEPEMVFFDGRTGSEMRNAFPRLQHQATREAIDEFLSDNPEREIFFFSRAGYSGRPGAAAFEDATFPGDESVDWSAETGLASVIPDMLNRAVGGLYGFTTDIGGYADWTGIPGTSKELYIRWAQMSVFTSHFRVHGSAFNGVRMPWFFEPDDPEPKAIDLWTAAAELHLLARPLLRDLWEEALETGMPMTRPMWLHDPSAEGNPHNDDQWMLGTDVLVAPVIEEGATEREVWLPTGCWQLHGVGPELDGAATISVAAPLEVLPWFTRCGTRPFDPSP